VQQKNQRHEISEELNELLVSICFVISEFLAKDAGQIIKVERDTFSVMETTLDLNHRQHVKGHYVCTSLQGCIELTPPLYDCHFTSPVASSGSKQASKSRLTHASQTQLSH